jgi:hypothetical protein
VQQHRRSQRFGGFQPASIKRVKRELDDLLIDLSQYDTGGFPHLEETPGVAMAPVAVAPAASKMDWQPADGAILAIMARVTMASLLRSSELVTETVRKSGVRIERDWPHPISEIVQGIRVGAPCAAPSLVEWRQVEYGSKAVVAHAIWVMLAGEKATAPTGAISSGLSELYAETQVGVEHGFSLALEPPSAADMAAVSRCARALSAGVLVPEGHIHVRGFTAMLMRCDLLARLAARPYELRLRGISIHDVASGVIAVSAGDCAACGLQPRRVW